MKKFVPILLGIAMAAGLAACTLPEDPLPDGPQQPPVYTIDRTEMTLAVGESGTLTLVPDAESTAAPVLYTWTCDDNAVATVEGSGLSATVTALSEGAVTVKAMDGETEIARCDVTVIAYPVVVNVPSGKLILRKNTVVTVKAWIAEGLEDPVTWESSDEAYGTVDYQGPIARVKAVKRGDCTITVRCGSYSACFQLVIGLN